MDDTAEQFSLTFRSLVGEGRFSDALTLTRRRMLRDALEWFAEDGIRLDPSEPLVAADLLSELALAARRAVKQLGDKVRAAGSPPLWFSMLDKSTDAASRDSRRAY